eukprot:Rmarinus@m.29792
MNDRFTFLQSLVTEFQETKDDTKKEHILAHLANFAYDAENFEYLRRLNIVELFIDFLTEDASFQSRRCRHMHRAIVQLYEAFGRTCAMMVSFWTADNIWQSGESATVVTIP